MQTMQQMIIEMQRTQAQAIGQLQAAEARAAEAEARAKIAEEKRSEKEKDQQDARTENTGITLKTFDRLESFSGERADWPDWSFSLKALIGEQGNEALKWAESQTTAIDIDLLNADQAGWKDINLVCSRRC